MERRSDHPLYFLLCFSLSRERGKNIYIASVLKLFEPRARVLFLFWWKEELGKRDWVVHFVAIEGLKKERAFARLVHEENF